MALESHTERRTEHSTVPVAFLFRLGQLSRDCPNYNRNGGETDEPTYPT